MNTEVTFQCDWIEQAVRKCLKKAEGPLFDNDLEAIKYVRIGEGFDNGFFIHLSTEKPSPLLRIPTAGMNGETPALILKMA